MVTDARSAGTITLLTHHARDDHATCCGGEMRSAQPIGAGHLFYPLAILSFGVRKALSHLPRDAAPPAQGPVVRQLADHLWWDRARRDDVPMNIVNEITEICLGVVDKANYTR